jgi:hypothetical protein
MNKLLIFVFIILSISIQDIHAQKDKKKKKNAEEKVEEKPKPKKAENAMKPYKEIITEKAITKTGLFTTHKVDDKYYFEIPDSLMEREILVVSRISGTIANFNFGGAGMKAQGQQVWKWQKKDNKLLIRSVSYNSVASEEQPIYQSVKNNNFDPVIQSFDIKTLTKDSSNYVIEVNDFFTTDVKAISAIDESNKKNFGIGGIDKARSFIDLTKSFPFNTEVRHVLTYNATKLPANSTTGTLSLEMNQSFVLLPKVPMQPREFDQRVGFFSVQQTDYGIDAQKAQSKRYITRWRLEPKDEEAFKRGELVEPKKQIVYYIDPATPEKWRKYLKQGIDDWEVAFRAAGFKNAIVAKDPPTKEEDPDWSPEDVRNSVLRYTANPIQNAMGPHVHDPRSGEIIESDIIWYHNVMNLLRNWFFIQTAAVNEDARKVKFDDELMGQLIRFVSAHEVGHTLGFPHNMGASFAYPTDSLRSKSFTERMGTAPSIMDYARFNYIAQPGDDAALFPAIGVYDKWVVKWGYTPILKANSSEEEKSVLNEWIKSHEGDPLYWYGKQTGNPIDPRGQTEDLGNDAMKSGSYGIANLKRIVPELMGWIKKDGENFDDLSELYSNAIAQWSRYGGHVKSNIGGVYETYKTYDQQGNVYEYVPKETQKSAMTWLQMVIFSTPSWLIEEEILNKVDGTSGLNQISRVQARVLNDLLNSERLTRMIEAETLQGSKTYTALEMLRELRTGIWSELAGGKKIDTYRRELQRAYLEKLSVLMADKNNSLSDVKPMIRAELKTLKSQIPGGISRTSDRLSKYHLEDALARIELILDPK